LIHELSMQRILWHRRHIDIGMDPSEIFSRPLLIYDDKCSSCTKFANIATTLSGGHIRIAGHYYSDEAIRSKDMIFPKTFDPTEMFWLINKNGAYGARCGLIQVIKEIIVALIKIRSIEKKNNKVKCSNCVISCGSTVNTFRRVAGMMRNSRKFSFHDN
jgi:hypothetical protein